jgi:hypothetical protein
MLLLPLVLIIATSGCTLPGGFCIPGFPCAPTHEEEHDVYVISSLDAFPKEVSPNQDLRLVAIVENRATRALEGGDSKVTVELYDYCEGLFTIEEGDSSQEIGLIPGEKAEVYWTLHSNKDTKLVSTCKLKIRAKYQYTTNSVTQVYLIDYAEMQRQLNEGTFTEQASPYSGSFGPLKPYLTVEDTQPIPVPSEDTEVSTVFGFQIKNKGNGFLTSCSADAEQDGQNPGITSDKITITAQGGEGSQLQGLLEDEIDDLNNKKLILIGKESPKLILAVEDWDVGNIPIKTTKVIETTIEDYCYEFRKEIDVKVEPKV